MAILLKNDNWPLHVCLNMLNIFGFLVPGRHSEQMKKLLSVYWLFLFSFIVGLYIIVQLGDLVQIWGDLTLMVNSSLLLFTNCALAAKIFVFVGRGRAVQHIIDEADCELKNEGTVAGKKIIKMCHRNTTILFVVFAALSGITVLGWSASAEKNRLPLRAWYPYDAYRSPAYEITYTHQTLALFLAAALNVSLDTTMSTLIALCCCRLRLAALALRTLCSGIRMNKHLIAPNQEKIIRSRLRVAVIRHQEALRAADEIQACFSEPILGQFAVSTIIICVTAYQLAVEANETSKNVVRIVGMTAYLLCMVLQVFLYCYQGNQLSLDSSGMASAVFECEWYSCSMKFRRSLLVVMARSQTTTKLTAGGLTTLSLATFTSIIKASYTFFTVLQQVEDRKA